jgi:hypothetical protein
VEVKWSSSRNGHFLPDEDPSCPLHRRLGGRSGFGHSRQEINVLPLPGIEARFVVRIPQRSGCADGGVKAVCTDGGVKAVCTDGGVKAVCTDGGVKAVCTDGGVKAVCADGVTTKDCAVRPRNVFMCRVAGAVNSTNG